jgi:hypothetical protein
MKPYIPILFSLSALILSGCSNPSAVQVSPGVYVLGRADHGGIFGNKDSLKASVIQDANRFAEKQGKVAIPLAAKEHPVGILADWATYEYTFKLVDRNDPEARIPKILVLADTRTSSEFRSLGGKDTYYIAKPIPQ